MITDDMIEIVAAATWNATSTPGWETWEATNPATKNRYRQDLRDGLEALVKAGYTVARNG